MQEFNLEEISFKSVVGKREGPHLLLIAGIHGDEYEPMAAANELLNILPKMVEKGVVTVVSIANLPAFNRASRVGEDGLDLARICPGNKNGSKTEKIAAELSELISKVDYLIDLHTGGSAYKLSPLCGYLLHPSEEVLSKQRQMAKAFNVQTIWGTNSSLNGRTLSIARDNNIPAVYTEYGGGGEFKKEIVQEYIKGCLNVLGLLGIIEGKITKCKSEYMVEDAREESGFLQLLHPSPADGFFEAKVKLGDFVEKNQLIGTVTNFLNQSIAPVLADQEGIIFLIRTIPSIKKGDALGGILPISQPGKVSFS